MTLTDFVSNFEKTTTPLLNNDIYYNYLGLMPIDKNSELIKYLKFGRFGILPIAKQRKEGYSGIYGLQIQPNQPWHKWPLVQILTGYDACSTLAPSYEKLPAMIMAKATTKKKLFDYLHGGIHKLLEVSPSIFNLFNASADINLLKNCFGDIANCPTQGHNHDSTIEKYISFITTLNNSPQHIFYRKEVERMRKDESYVPHSIAKKELGIWYTSLVNKAAVRSLDLSNQSNHLFWECLTLLHGMNGCMEFENVSHYTQDTYNSKFSLGSVALEIDITETIKSHPLHITVKPLAKHNTNYTGAEHLIAAAVLDEEHKDPLAAFNALVSGAYWAGHNMKKALPKIHNQMLNLCKREGWTDAEFALSMMI